MSRRPATDRLPPWRRRLVLSTWLAAALMICLRAGQVQLAQGATWRSIAEDQHLSDMVVPATRGSILDRDGTPLAVSRERIRVSVAPRELGDVEATRALLRETLGLSSSSVVRLTSRDRTWAVAPDVYASVVREQLRGVPGVHLEPVLQRYHPHGDLARGVLGEIQEDRGAGGVENTFEELLGGTPGREVIARDNFGRPIPGERVMMTAPRAGGEVVLTLDMDLQEIAQQALEEAIEQTHAHGGDVVITDPDTGEILALFSMRAGRTTALSAINTPYEPGSTIKPFTVAGLLQHGLASLDDTVDVGNGRWEIDGRLITDTHTGNSRISVAEALRESSNIGIGKAAEAFTPGVQYETLRDFGFGGLAGIELPGEAAGMLRRPDRWTAMSDESLAIGYELSATPLQLAMAYGALANGGLLMQPRLIRETRDADGRTVERFAPRIVRRVISPQVADQVAEALVDVVEDGTGSSARMASFQVAGKTGTAWLDSGEGYERGAYYSSFAGFFPADDPQLVVFVGLDQPQGTYYGGAVAAPVTRATMEAALAARATPLDRGALIRSTRRDPATLALQTSSFAARNDAAPAPAPVDLRDAAGGVSLPDVAGLPARVAVRRLHALGLRVVPVGSGDIRTTRPPAGTRVLPGDTISLRLGATGR